MADNEFDYYSGDDLGVIYHTTGTNFRLWAPTAKKIEVFIFNGMEENEPEIKQELTQDVHGTWTTCIEDDLVGKYYCYQVHLADEVNMVIDPYTKGVGTNSNRGLIVDLLATNPSGWEDDHQISLKNLQDAVIYEIHVRDFSIAENSGIKHKGKYLGFTEKNTVNGEGDKTGLDHLLELGITHVHLLPVFDFASVDDINEEDYNWGYDPLFYNVPEGSYSTNPADDTRIREFKQLVKTLHDNGIGVIMDVVYNHTYYTKKSAFNKIVPGYYYRFDEEGNLANGSGVGNEIASEKPMVRKFIIDSVKYWAEEYHIDGFRFDLMALIDKKTMSEVEKTLHQINSSILIYGEPWTGGISPLTRDKQMVKGAQQGMKIAVFNDNFRSGLKGDNDSVQRGFISGEIYRELPIRKGVVGSINYNDKINDFALEPSETINYVSAHDNLTLWDKLSRSNDFDSEEVRIKMDQLAQSIILTSQGIPFIHGGAEMLRTKFGNHNSYNAGDRVNKLKWERKSKYQQTFKYYQGLIKLRKEHPAFRMENQQQIKNKLEFLISPDDTVSFILKDKANGDSWKNIVVIYNPTREEKFFELPYRLEWTVVVDEQKAGTEKIKVLTGDTIRVPMISACVLYS